MDVAVDGEVLNCYREVGNTHDPNWRASAVTSSSKKGCSDSWPHSSCYILYLFIFYTEEELFHVKASQPSQVVVVV